MLKGLKVRIYPTKRQQEMLEKYFGCIRWYWNNSLIEIQKTYQETGKGLGQFAFRKWTCKGCGKEVNRDYNAALNIKAEGLRLLADGTAATACGGSVRQ